VPLQVAIWHTRTGDSLVSPHGQPGDRLWVRETWRIAGEMAHDPGYFEYRASCRGNINDVGDLIPRWRPSIHMPRAASRIQLEITGVRVERLNDCSEADAVAEGIRPFKDGWERFHTDPADTEHTGATKDPRLAYKGLWEQINGAGAWEANPWVWVVEFRRLTP